LLRQPQAGLTNNYNMDLVEYHLDTYENWEQYQSMALFTPSEFERLANSNTDVRNVHEVMELNKQVRSMYDRLQHEYQSAKYWKAKCNEIKEQMTMMHDRLQCEYQSAKYWRAEYIELGKQMKLLRDRLQCVEGIVKK